MGVEGNSGSASVRMDPGGPDVGQLRRTISFHQVFSKTSFAQNPPRCSQQG